MGTLLVTGAAGFIGQAVCRHLLQHGHRVVGIDNCHRYYDPALKQYRLEQLQTFDNWTFHHIDCADRDAMSDLFQAVHPSASAT